MKSTQKQPNCKKSCGPCKKGSMKKVVKSKKAAQKWLWWFDNGRIFNNNNSGEFVLPPPTAWASPSFVVWLFLCVAIFVEVCILKKEKLRNFAHFYLMNSIFLCRMTYYRVPWSHTWLSGKYCICYALRCWATKWL